MKTSELNGAALDWAVAKCECGDDIAEIDDPHFYSTDWAIGGPIIEREGIALHGNPTWCAQYSVTVRAHHGGYRGYFRHVGPTPLIAAMRCFVASRLGDEVDIPKEIQTP